MWPCYGFLSNSGRPLLKINYLSQLHILFIIIKNIVIFLRPYIYTYGLSCLSYPKAVYIQINMFSFQDTPGGSRNPKEVWMENCNLNERYVWLNNQDIEPLWLNIEEVPGYPGTRSTADAEAIVSWGWEVARSRWHYIWQDRNFNQPDREEIIFTAEQINSRLLTSSFARRTEIEVLIAENDELSNDRRP